MTCTNCGDSPIAMEYRLRFTPEGRHDREMDLYLCGACLEMLCREPGIELVEDPVGAPMADLASWE